MRLHQAFWRGDALVPQRREHYCTSERPFSRIPPRHALQDPPLEPTAQVLLDHARSILADGPPLSMNVELSPGDELPAAMHTLNQGAVWACLMGGGANPDLQDLIRNALAPESKCLWFLCRKFFFTLNVAEKDGEYYQFSNGNTHYHHRMYMGRLFMLRPDNLAIFIRARMPRALEVYSCNFSHLTRTPKGLWAWSLDWHWNATRLTFTSCPNIAELEASLPPWEKNRMVIDVSEQACRRFILTPVGTVMAGNGACFTVHDDLRRYVFHPVAVPTGFIPDRIMYGGGQLSSPRAISR
ncbi:hypothetical protein J8273_7639 [Carpediemonas membranifera]|uniref:Uncharacterized protein n=1 Tax=Carpediemonas membranifera TaxID=201153 RepID=A0A8J6AZY8_9EUKA|nr:hypothetical protein J8273_7639 [Carpediemonas membranifera]|eukprot:KAG9391294.1 hypothetical protein J8273_7639 [Carpediemonas membranifera]